MSCYNNSYYKNTDRKNSCSGGCSDRDRSKNIKRYENEYDVIGENYYIDNVNHHDNYYNKYHHYYITDQDQINNYYTEYNVYHHDRIATSENNQYLGSKDIYMSEFEGRPGQGNCQRPGQGNCQRPGQGHGQCHGQGHGQCQCQRPEPRVYKECNEYRPNCNERPTPCECNCSCNCYKKNNCKKY